MENCWQLSSFGFSQNTLRSLDILTMHIDWKRKISSHILREERNYFLGLPIYHIIIGRQVCVCRMILLILKSTLTVNSRHFYLETKETEKWSTLIQRKKKKTTRRELKTSNQIIINRLCCMITTQGEKIEELTCDENTLEINGKERVKSEK